MALINCKECNQEISSKAEKCPHCGYELKKKSGCGCFSIIGVGIILIIILYIIGSNETSNGVVSDYDGPPKFVLTEMNGRELEDEAYFTVFYDNTFELELYDGTIYKYIPTQHIGSDPLCNIVATDNHGRTTAICIKKLSGNEVMIMLENDEMISNFKGHKQ